MSCTKATMKRCKIAVAKIQAVFYKFNKFAKKKKKLVQMVIWLRNNKCWNSVIKLRLPLMWLPQPDDFKWL